MTFEVSQKHSHTCPWEIDSQFPCTLKISITWVELVYKWHSYSGKITLTSQKWYECIYCLMWKKKKKKKALTVINFINSFIRFTALSSCHQMRVRKVETDIPERHRYVAYWSLEDLFTSFWLLLHLFVYLHSLCLLTVHVWLESIAMSDT